MKLHESQPALETLRTLRNLGLLSDHETQAINAFASPNSRFEDALARAETLHLHIKVEDTDALPINEFFKSGAELDHQKRGFVKYRFPGAINAIFSHIKVSEEELVETESNRRPRPFLDHIGIDLRGETEATRAAFDALEALAKEESIPMTPQGDPTRPVYCCHVEVAEKRWLYPPEGHALAGIPLEFAYGALKVNPEQSGCDLRPADPNRIDPASIPKCGGAPSDATRGAGPGDAYYLRSDLARFGEIGRANPGLSAAFFDYYGKVFEPDKLTRREKSLIALATAHALKCPYCIDSISNNLLDLEVSEAEMMEAIHVAAAMAAGGALAHGAQTLGHVDDRVAHSSHNGSASH